MSFDISLDDYGPLATGAIPTADTYQERWLEDWERPYWADVLQWRMNLVTAISKTLAGHERRLAAPESAPDAEQVGELQLRLAAEYDGRVVAETKLAAIRDLLKHYEHQAATRPNTSCEENPEGLLLDMISERREVLDE